MSYANNLKLDSNGHIIIGPSVIAQKRKQQKAMVNGLPKDTDGRIIIGSRYSNLLYDTLDITNDSKYLSQKKSKKKKLKKKGKKRQKKYYRDLKLKKQKLKHDKKLHELKEQNVESRKVNLSAVLSQLLSSKELMCVFDNNIFAYSDQKYYFSVCTQHQAQVMLMQLLDSYERLYVTPRDIKNALDTIMVLPELQKDLSPRVNIPLVNCENGVFDLESMTLLKHSPKYGFTRCIHAKYDKEAQGPVFRKWLDEATGGDKEIKRLLQEVLGYVLSEYICAKVAFMFYGVKDSGKSVLLSVIGRMVGEHNVSHVGIQRLSEPCYGARLKQAKLNIDTDASDAQMKDVGIFKSMVGGLDIIETKELYKNPSSQPCYCKLLFGANSYIPLGHLDSNNLDAFFRRIQIIPFLFSKPVPEQDMQLNEKMWSERDYIFTWAMKGAKRLINNNFVFTHSTVSEQKLNEYKAQYSPEQCFFSEHLKLMEKSIVSAEEVQSAYEDYAETLGVKIGRYDMKGFISRSYPQVKQKRKRINGSKNPLAVYEGLAFVE